MRLKIQIALVLIAALLLICGCGKKQSAREKEKPAAQQLAYDENANAHLEIQRAIERASLTGKKILLIFGANWCPWCRSLHRLFETDAEIKDYLKQHFEVVWVDVGKKDKNMDLDDKYGNPVAKGIPVIVVLDSNGNYLYTQDTGSLEKPAKEKGHAREKILEFLRRWGESVNVSEIPTEDFSKFFV